MGNIQGGLKDNPDHQGDDTEREGTARAKELFERGRRGGGECHHHGPFLGDVLPGTLRMKRGVAAVTTMIPMESEEDDADLADDVYAFIRKTPLPWSQSRIMQVAQVEFRGVDRDTFRATVAGVLTGMKKTAQHILMASIRNGTPYRGGRAAAIYLDTDTVDIYI